MAMHVYHQGLPGYNANAVLQDGCPECEDRSKRGLDGFLELDEGNSRKLWYLMVRSEWGGSEDNHRAVSACDARMSKALYRVAVMLERYSNVKPWNPLNELTCTESSGGLKITNPDGPGTTIIEPR